MNDDDVMWLLVLPRSRIVRISKKLNWEKGMCYCVIGPVFTFKLSLLNSEKHEEFKKVLRSGTLITYLRRLPVDSRD